MDSIPPPPSVASAIPPSLPPIMIPSGYIRPSLGKRKPVYSTNDDPLPPQLIVPLTNCVVPTKPPKCVTPKQEGVPTPKYEAPPTKKPKCVTPKPGEPNISAGYYDIVHYQDPIPKKQSGGKTPNKGILTPRLKLRPKQPLTPQREKTFVVEPKLPLCARTPNTPEMSPGMKLPRCARTPDFNPWIPESTKGAREIKIMAKTPIGTIARVPTSDRQPVYIPKPIEVANNESILNASIYLDLSDRDYHYVSSKMRTLSENTKNLQKQYSNLLKPYPKITGPMNSDKFEKILLVYENNQVYYQDLLDHPQPNIPEITAKLHELEQWFTGFPEPRPHDKLDLEAWKEREKFRKTNNISQYCDPTLYKYLLPPNHPLLTIKDD